jgi:hypothetical protein
VVACQQNIYPVQVKRLTWGGWVDAGLDDYLSRGGSFSNRGHQGSYVSFLNVNIENVRFILKVKDLESLRSRRRDAGDAGT